MQANVKSANARQVCAVESSGLHVARATNASLVGEIKIVRQENAGPVNALKTPTKAAESASQMSVRSVVRMTNVILGNVGTVFVPMELTTVCYSAGGARNVTSVTAIVTVLQGLVRITNVLSRVKSSGVETPNRE